MMSQMMPSKVGFLPTRLPDLFQWCSCRRSPITLNGSNLSQWNDISGNNNHWTQGTASLQPLFTDQIEGVTVPTFDGVDDQMIASIGFPTGNYSIFVAFKTTSLRGVFLGRDNTGFGTVDATFGVGTQNQVAVPDGHVAFERQASGPNRSDGINSVIAYNDNVIHFAGIVIDGFDLDLYVDDTHVSTTGTISGAFKFSPILLGIGFNGISIPFLGNIPETIIYDRAVSPEEVGFIKNYTDRMWNI